MWPEGIPPPDLSSPAPTADAAAAPLRPLFPDDIHGAPVDLGPSQGLQGAPGRVLVRHLYVSEPLAPPRGPRAVRRRPGAAIGVRREGARGASPGGGLGPSPPSMPCHLDRSAAL